MHGDRPVEVERLKDFAKQVFGTLKGAVTAGLVYLGDELGLYRALAEGGAATSAELAERSGLDERWVREWLYNQAAARIARRHARRALRALAGGPRGARGRVASRLRGGDVLAAAARRSARRNACATAFAAGSVCRTTPSVPRARAASSEASRRGCAASWCRA